VGVGEAEQDSDFANQCTGIRSTVECGMTLCENTDEVSYPGIAIEIERGDVAISILQNIAIL
jgi:hypothetical protein